MDEGRHTGSRQARQDPWTTRRPDRGHERRSARFSSTTSLSPKFQLPSFHFERLFPPVCSPDVIQNGTSVDQQSLSPVRPGSGRGMNRCCVRQEALGTSYSPIAQLGCYRLLYPSYINHIYIHLWISLLFQLLIRGRRCVYRSSQRPLAVPRPASTTLPMRQSETSPADFLQFLPDLMKQEHMCVSICISKGMIDGPLEQCPRDRAERPHLGLFTRIPLGWEDREPQHSRKLKKELEMTTEAT